MPSTLLHSSKRRRNHGHNEPLILSTIFFPFPHHINQFKVFKSPITEFSLKPKILLSKSSLSSINCLFSSSHFSLNFKNQFFFGKSGAPPRKRLDFRSWAILGFNFGNFESVQSILEATAVLTTIIIVHKSGHFLAAYLQGIQASKFAFHAC
jgi:hypothetical protein